MNGGGWPTSEIWVPHLRRGFIATKMGHRAKHDPVTSDTSDVDGGRFVVQVMAKRRPAPVLRPFHEASSDWIAVHVFQLFDSLVVGEDVEVVVAGLPEGFRAETLRDRQLEGLDRLRKRDLVVQRFADEEMDVLGHDDVAEDFEVVASAGEFEGVEEDVF